MSTIADASIKTFSYNEFPLPWKPPGWSALLKSCAEDFIVDEKLSYDIDELDGTGQNLSEEHLYVWIQKKNLNTLQVVSFLADYFQVSTEDIHYAGLKDKHAITRQWFSIRLPGQKKRLDTALLKNFNLYLYAKTSLRNMPFLKTELASTSNKEEVECQILQANWHSFAIKRGAISENEFTIVLRGSSPVKNEVIEILQKLKQTGFANYYGLQRFGHNGGNLQKALSWFKGNLLVKKSQQSLLISSVRSFLFNQILANRVLNNCWGSLEPTDYYPSDGTRNDFNIDGNEQDIQSKISSEGHSPSVALFRKEEYFRQDETESIDSFVYKLHPELCQGLVQLSFKHRIRPLRVVPGNLSWVIEQPYNLILKFSLPAGCYATTFVQHLADIQDSSHQG